VATPLGLFPRHHPDLPDSLPEHVRRGVEEEIVSGRLEPGARVTEEALADRFRVSRTSVREAMRLLESAGLLERDRGRSAVVAAQTPPDEARVIYDVRLQVETFLTERAATRMTDAELARLVDLQRRFSALLDTGDEDDDRRISELVFVDSQLHWTIYAAAASDMTSVVVSYWGRLQRELAARVYRRASPAAFGRQHDALIGALRARDGRAARELMERHLRESKDAILAGYEDAA
jgi:DNA-binding GntR family transcriptional regulator